MGSALVSRWSRRLEKPMRMIPRSLLFDLAIFGSLLSFPTCIRQAYAISRCRMCGVIILVGTVEIRAHVPRHGVFRSHSEDRQAVKAGKLVCSPARLIPAPGPLLRGGLKYIYTYA